MSKSMNEYRVSWMSWPPGSAKPHAGQRVTEDEASARNQYKGLLGMEADHEIRPCGKHVWDPALEVRRTAEWEPIND